MSAWRDRWAGWAPRLAVVAHDLTMVWVVWQVLHRLRYATMAAPLSMPLWSTEITLVLLAQGLVFWQVGLYRGLWRFASLPDLVNIVKASVLGLVTIGVTLFLYNRGELISRAALLLYPLALTGMLGTPRVLFRSWKDHSSERALRQDAVRTLVLGAGQAGEALVRDLRRSGHYQPVGFLDDAARLRGTLVHGVPVLGRLDEVVRIARETAARLLVIAIPSAEASTVQRVVAECEKSGIPFRMVPNLHDVLEGRSLPGQLKEVAIEDLLGRQPVLPDWRAIREWLGGRSVLVTGAGGSIGSELCRQCARHGSRRLALVEINELALVTAHSALRRDFPDVELIPILGDCGDPAVMRHAMELVRPDTVFHAAAYKHVPLLEGQMREAVRNNVLTTETVAAASVDAGVGTFVLISTDKAVDPVNVLGATKRLAEMTALTLAHGQPTRCVTVRFGNVLDSAGSVVPLFREQIRRGGPVTVTDPDVTRFFMTIPEACVLILQASAMGTHEAIYTLDMGEPVAIRVLAEQMIRLAGKQPGRDIAIMYTGLRPGEKLHETLFHADERYRATSHPKILLAEPRDVPFAQVRKALVSLRDASRDYDNPMLGELLRAAVPEFTPMAPSFDITGGASTVIPFPGRGGRA